MNVNTIYALNLELVKPFYFFSKGAVSGMCQGRTRTIALNVPQDENGHHVIEYVSDDSLAKWRWVTSLPPIDLIAASSIQKWEDLRVTVAAEFRKWHIIY